MAIETYNGGLGFIKVECSFLPHKGMGIVYCTPGRYQIKEVDPLGLAIDLPYMHNILVTWEEIYKNCSFECSQDPNGSGVNYFYDAAYD